MNDIPIPPEVIEAATRAYRRERDQVEYFGATEYTGPGLIEAAIRAALKEMGLKEERRRRSEVYQGLVDTYWRFVTDWRLVEVYERERRLRASLEDLARAHHGSVHDPDIAIESCPEHTCLNALKALAAVHDDGSGKQPYGMFDLDPAVAALRRWADKRLGLPSAEAAEAFRAGFHAAVPEDQCRSHSQDGERCDLPTGHDGRHEHDGGRLGPRESRHSIATWTDGAAVPEGPGEPSEAQRTQIAGVLRDWIHETPMSQCDAGSDTCPDWPLAYEVADRVCAALREQEGAP